MKEVGVKFLDLLERSVIVQAMLPFVFGLPCIIMAMRGQEVPAWMLNVTLMTITFWMGAKGQYVVDANRQSR